jgi:acyl-CoA thioesterase-1
VGRNLIALLGAVALYGFLSATAQAQVVALGASNTAGKGIAPQEAYPAQLEAMLRAKGYNGHVVNAGLSCAHSRTGLVAPVGPAEPVAYIRPPSFTSGGAGAIQGTARLLGPLSIRPRVRISNGCGKERN